MTTPLVRTIDFLRGLAIAPAHEFASFSNAVETLERVAIGEAGDCAAMLCAPARAIARQMKHATPETQKHLRDCLATLAAALASELEAHGGAKQPYYVGGG